MGCSQGGQLVQGGEGIAHVLPPVSYTHLVGKKAANWACMSGAYSSISPRPLSTPMVETMPSLATKPLREMCIRDSGRTVLAGNEKWMDANHIARPQGEKPVGTCLLYTSPGAPPR